jgi:hypothetical protein
MRRGSFFRFMLPVVALWIANSANACPSCHGDVNSSETQAMKWAIVSLLGFTGTVLAGASALFLYLRKRAAEFNRRFSDKLN